MNERRGVPQDPVEAAKWCVKAAAQGYGPARNWLRERYPQALPIIDEGERGVNALLDAAEKPRKDGG